MDAVKTVHLLVGSVIRHENRLFNDNIVRACGLQAINKPGIFYLIVHSG